MAGQASSFRTQRLSPIFRLYDLALAWNTFGPGATEHAMTGFDHAEPEEVGPANAESEKTCV